MAGIMRTFVISSFALVLTVWPLRAVSTVPQSFAAEPTVFGIEVVRQYPHDPSAFTQGLVYHAGRLIESTGRFGRSQLRQVDLRTGVAQRIRHLERDQFGEGLAVVGRQLIQLTWLNGLALVYDIESFDLRTTVRYTGEGWGLTTLNDLLIMSDGTDVLKVIDPATAAVVRRISVTRGGIPLGKLNELELVGHSIYANVWKEDFIAIISPDSGRVTGVVDVAPLVSRVVRTEPDSVLNGIAYDPTGRRLFITGKNWPVLFEVRITPPRLAL